MVELFTLIILVCLGWNAAGVLTATTPKKRRNSVIWACIFGLIGLVLVLLALLA